MMPTWVGTGQNLIFSYKKVDFSAVVNIPIKTLWRYAIFALIYETRWK